MNKIEPLPGATMPKQTLLQGMPYVHSTHTDIGQRLRAWQQEQQRRAFHAENVASINARNK